MKSWILLGKTGFVGQHLYSQLEEVTAPSRSQCDLCNEASVRAFFEAQPRSHVIFAAGVGRSRSNRADENIWMAENLCAVEDQIEHLTFLSSMDIYGRNRILDQNSEPAPSEPYGESKWKSEEILRDRFENRLTILRLPGVYGAGDKGSSVLGQMILSAAMDKSIELRSNVLRDFLWVEDLARAVKEERKGTFDFVPGHPRTLGEWAGLIQKEIPGVQVFEKNTDTQFDFKMPGNFLDFEFSDPRICIRDYVSSQRF